MAREDNVKEKVEGDNELYKPTFIWECIWDQFRLYRQAHVQKWQQTRLHCTVSSDVRLNNVVQQRAAMRCLTTGETGKSVRANDKGTKEVIKRSGLDHAE